MSTARRSPNWPARHHTGGHVSFTFRDDAVDRLGYRAEQQRLIDAGVWELVDLTEPMALIHEDGEDIMLRVWTWRVY